jgi:hypothetical protein
MRHLLIALALGAVVLAVLFFAPAAAG